MSPDELRRFFPGASESTRKRNAVDSVASQEPERNSPDEPLATDALQNLGQGRCLVCFTLFRRRLLDDDNPYLKPFLDGLKEAGVIVDDSKAWCEVKVIQRLVTLPASEGIQISVTKL